MNDAVQHDPVQQLQLSESALIGRIIADAFADDPVNLWAFNGTGAMRPVFTAMARYLYLPKGFGHRSADGKAGSLWLPPGVAKHYGLRASLAIAPAILRHGGLTAVRRGLALDGFMTANRPAEPHYYLFAIGVHPSLQGKGRGGQLMRAALARVDRDGMPAYLESSKESNVPFYRNHGFELLEAVVPTAGCPPLWRMWRPATRSL